MSNEGTLFINVDCSKPHLRRGRRGICIIYFDDSGNEITDGILLNGYTGPLKKNGIICIKCVYVEVIS